MKKWKQIEKEFIKWDKKNNFQASQRDILNWFKVKFKQNNIKEQLKDAIADEHRKHIHLTCNPG